MKEWCSFSAGAGRRLFAVAFLLCAQALAVAASSMKWQEGIECCRELLPQTLDRFLVSFTRRRHCESTARALLASYSQHGMYVLSETCLHRETCNRLVTPGSIPEYTHNNLPAIDGLTARRCSHWLGLASCLTRTYELEGKSEVESLPWMYTSCLLCCPPQEAQQCPCVMQQTRANGSISKLL